MLRKGTALTARPFDLELGSFSATIGFVNPLDRRRKFLKFFGRSAWPRHQLTSAIWASALKNRLGT